MPIHKNDIVTNNIQFVAGYNNQYIVPAGTILKVYKATRNGAIYCSVIDRTIYYGTLTLKTTDVTKVNAPLPTVNVGDIFVCSWGYDQTNIDYYKVIKVLNKSVVIADISKTRTYTGTMQGKCVPNPNDVGNKTYTKRMINHYDSVCLKITSFSWAYPWDGKPNHFTEWA